MRTRLVRMRASPSNGFILLRTCTRRDNPKSEGKIGTQTVNEPCCQSTAPIRNQGDPSESGEVQAYRGHGLFCSYARRKSGREFDLMGRDNPRFRKCMVNVLYVRTVWVFSQKVKLPLPQGQITPVRDSHKNGV